LLLKFPTEAWNAAVVAPSATLTVGGTLRAEGPLEEIVTEVEPARAGEVKVTVHVADEFGFSDAGVHCSDETLTTISVT